MLSSSRREAESGGSANWAPPEGVLLAGSDPGDGAAMGASL